MIQQLLSDDVQDFIDTHIRSAVVRLNGEDVSYPIFNTRRDGNTIKKLVYLQTEEGKVTEAWLVDANGRRLQSSEVNVTKNENGYMIVFIIEVEIKVKVKGVPAS